MTDLSERMDISPDQAKLLLPLLNRYLPNTTAWAYGSRVKFTSSDRSDLDMVVFPEKDRLLAVEDFREALEYSDLPFRVDLFVWDDIPADFQENIRREHVVLSDYD